jgi:hypothetical protein
VFVPCPAIFLQSRNVPSFSCRDSEQYPLAVLFSGAYEILYVVHEVVAFWYGVVLPIVIYYYTNIGDEPRSPGGLQENYGDNTYRK